MSVCRFSKNINRDDDGVSFEWDACSFLWEIRDKMEHQSVAKMDIRWV